MPDTYLCPSCDRMVPVGKPCPCTRTKRRKKKRKPPPPKQSWEQDDSYDGLDLPEDSFDYHEFIAKEFGDEKPHTQIGIRKLWWVTALILSIIFFGGLVILILRALFLR